MGAIERFTRYHQKAKQRCGDDYLMRMLRHNPITGFSNLWSVGKAVTKSRLPASPDFLPPTVFIELTNRCNLKCGTCILGTDRAYVGYEKRDITYEEFERILEQIPALSHVWLQGIGEPLLHPDLLRMVRSAWGRGISAGINTNGVLLNEKAARGLIDAHLSEMFISMSSVDPAEFKASRSGASIQKVLRNLRGLVAAKRGAGVKYPFVGARAIFMDAAIPGAEDLIRALADIGADAVAFQDYAVGMGTAEMDKQKVKRERLDDIVPKLVDLGAQLGLRVDIELTGTGKGSCVQPWFSPYVTAEGFVTPCCSSWHPLAINFGNIFQQPFEEIWRGEAFVKFRQEFYDARPKVCRGCPSY